MRDQFNLDVDRWSVGRVLHQLVLPHKKTLHAKEQNQSEVRQARSDWIRKRQPFMGKRLERLVFIDMAGLKTKLTKRTDWAPA